MSANAQQLLQAITRRFTDDLEIRQDGDVLVCLTPFEYPDGDAIRVWVEPSPTGGRRLTDHSEGWSRILSNQGSAPRPLADKARALVAMEALSLDFGEVCLEEVGDDLVDGIISVALTTQRIAMLTDQLIPTTQAATKKQERGMVVASQHEWERLRDEYPMDEFASRVYTISDWARMRGIGAGPIVAFDELEMILGMMGVPGSLSVASVTGTADNPENFTAVERARVRAEKPQ